MSKVFNKSSITNILSLFLLLCGVWLSYQDILPVLSPYIKNAGLFALSGAFTNWIAIFMLFEKIPLLYGSGVIPNNFEAFKTSIREMILENFFNKENFDTLAHALPEHNVNSEYVLSHIDENILFDNLLEVVASSSFGAMLNMVGGPKILEKLREPFNQKIKIKIEEIIDSIDWRNALNTALEFETLRPGIETMIDHKLAELSPSHVKKIVKEMIAQHLGWLVVWGGVFGGLLGIISTLLVIL